MAEAFARMGGMFAHLCAPRHEPLVRDVQQEVERRWARLKALAASALL